MPGATNHYSMGFEVRHTDVSGPTHQQLKRQKDKGTQVTIDMELQDKRKTRTKTESEITVSE